MKYKDKSKKTKKNNNNNKKQTANLEMPKIYIKKDAPGTYKSPNTKYSINHA